MQLSQALTQHPTSHLRVPVIKRAKCSKQDSANDYVVKMRDDKVGKAQLPIDRRRRLYDAGETSDQKLEQKTYAEQHRHFKPNPSAPHRANPVEDLDSGGDADSHGCEGKETIGVGIHAHGKHVVRPDT